MYCQMGYSYPHGCFQMCLEPGCSCYGDGREPDIFIITEHQNVAAHLLQLEV